jgi:hypothetical protein
MQCSTSTQTEYSVITEACSLAQTGQELLRVAALSTSKCATASIPVQCDRDREWEEYPACQLLVGDVKIDSFVSFEAPVPCDVFGKVTEKYHDPKRDKTVLTVTCEDGTVASCRYYYHETVNVVSPPTAMCDLLAPAKDAPS